MSNQFKSFAVGGGANAMPATDWAALTALLANGFSSGVANSEQFNTLMRQVSSMAQMVGDFISGQGFNAVDDGNIANLLTAFTNGLQNFLALKAGSTTQAFQAADGTSGKQVVNFSQFGRSFGSAGYQRFPNGLILQWGTGSTGAGGLAALAFPTAFPNALLKVIPAVGTATPVADCIGCDNGTTSTINIYVSNSAGSGLSGVTAHYIAIGW